MTEKFSALLNQLNISYEVFYHPALITADDADLYGVIRPGARVKHLFLRDNYGRRHFLYILPYDKQVDLKILSKEYQISRLGFASTERLQTYLQTERGSVSFLSIINDKENAVELWFDKSLQHGEKLQCIVNGTTQTWVIRMEDILQVAHHTNHKINWISEG